MLTNNLEITSAEYWNKIYSGNNDGAKVDASNTTRPANPFDRFGWVAAHAEGPTVFGIASGHAHIEKRIKALHPDWYVQASDQAVAAVAVANYPTYIICSAYATPWKDKTFRTVICTQAMEYMEDQEKFLFEASRIADILLITVPIGEMKKWSQLRIYTEENVRELLTRFGQIILMERHDDLLLVKLKF